VEGVYLQARKPRSSRMILKLMKENYLSFYHEVFGEEVVHPLISRVFAFVIDYISVLVLSTLLYYSLDSIGMYSVETELVIEVFILIYFTCSNNKIFNGQTLGKRLLGIQVRDSNGEYLGWMRSFIRTIPIMTIFNYDRILRYLSYEESIFTSVVYLGFLFLAFGMIYFLCLQLNRQSVHDMLVSSQVVRKNEVVVFEMKLNKALILGYLIIVGAYLIVVFY
jgi:uncharacterized RDD family membrane protein YckC